MGVPCTTVSVDEMALGEALAPWVCPGRPIFKNNPVEVYFPDSNECASVTVPWEDVCEPDVAF